MMMAVMTQQPRETEPAPSLLARLTAPAASKPLTETDKAVQRAIAPRQAAQTATARGQKVAMLDESILDHATVSSLSRAAVSEAKGGDRPRP